MAPSRVARLGASALLSLILTASLAPLAAATSPSGTAVAAVSPASSFPDGTYVVGTNIQPGTYRTRAASAYCYWERLSGFGGTVDEIIANDITSGPAVVTISPSDVGFSSEDCGTWTSDLSAIVSPGDPIPEGTYIVGTDLQPGTYRNSDSSAYCYWARLSGFGGTLDEIIANDFTNALAVVTIGASDVGFLSSDCGTWTQVVAPPVPGTYHAVTPTRVLDTRDGTGGLSGPFTNHAARTFQVTGGVVPSGATAVTGNLTVTGQTSSGYLFIGPVATNNPTSSTLNFPLGDDRANGVTVALSGSGTLSITFVGPSNGTSAQAIFDVTGYFTPDPSGATYHAVTPTRLLDTRNGTGGLSGPFGNHVARTFQVTGGVVPAGATAVTGNLTVTGQTSKGYLFIGPVATNNPTSSTLNFPLGDDRANAVTVALSGTGTLSITFVGPANGTSAQAIFDVTGYFTADLTGARYVPLSPTRLLDTRNGTGGLSGPFTNHAARTFQVSGGSSGVPANAAAVTGNLTVTGQTSGGYLFIGPVATNYPTSSTLNFPLGDDRANGVTVALSGSGTLSITFVGPANGTSAQAIFDVTGYFVKAVIW